MAIFTTSFITPSNYFYDSSKIEIISGIAKLKETSLWNNLEVYYRMEESSWNGTINEIVDLSNNSIHATAYNGANTILSGKVGRGSNFDGVDDYAVSTNNIPTSLLGNPDFTVSFWLYVPTGAVMTGTPYRQFFSYGGPSIPNLAQITNFNTIPNQIYVGWYGGGGLHTVNTFAYDTWVHVLWSRTGAGTVINGNEVYYNNVLQTLTPLPAAGDPSPNVLAGPFKIQRGVPTAPRFIQCRIDEICVWSKLLSSSERAIIYNAGAGTIINKYASDKPTIYKTAGDAAIIGAWNGFVVTTGTVNGALGYQLSEDGTIWKYWDGGAWVSAIGDQYNSEFTVNSNIGTFPKAQNKIYVRTWLDSNGTQQVEIDEIQLNYTSNFNPSVDAGSNKVCFDNQTISPFSDCDFYDTDGTVDRVYYKIDGEVDTWTEILQGSYGTLLEAAQAFQYSFNNTGVKTARLQAEDNLGAVNDDSLTITVSQYTKVVNVKDIVTGDHLLNFDFNPGDGSGAAQQDSPFSWSWDYGNFDITIEKMFFYVKQEAVLIENEDELTIFVQASAFLSQGVATIGLMTEGDQLAIMVWLQQGGQLIDNPTSCVVDLYDQDNVIQYTASSSSPEPNGHFKFSKSPSNLPNEGVYHLNVQITAGGVDFINTVPVGLMERKLISFEGKVHINTISGTTGTNFPLGSPLYPVTNWSDAKIIAEKNKLRIIQVIGDLSITALESIVEYQFKGVAGHLSSIVLNGGNTSGASFENMGVSGTVGGKIHLRYCHLSNLTNFYGEVYNSGLEGTIVLGGGAESLFNECHNAVEGVNPSVIDFGGVGQSLNLSAYSGEIILKNMTGSEGSTIDILSGQVTIDSTCTNGLVVVRGNCDIFVDNSGPNCNVIRPLLQDLKDEAMGKWILNPDAKTLTLYRLDGTVLQVLDLMSTTKTLPSFIGRDPK